MHRLSCWLLHFGETAPAPGCWPWCILFVFIFIDVSVDTWCLAGTVRWPEDSWGEEGSWRGDDSRLICENMQISHGHLGEIRCTRVPNRDKPLPCLTGCGPPAAGRHSSCTPPSAPPSSWPPQNLPCPWHIAFPRRTELNALPPETAAARSLLVLLHLNPAIPTVNVKIQQLVFSLLPERLAVSGSNSSSTQTDCHS